MDQKNNQEDYTHYKEYFQRSSKSAIVMSLIISTIAFVIAFIVYSSSIVEHNLLWYTLLILSIAVGFMFLAYPFLLWRIHSKSLQKGLIGVKVNNEGLHLLYRNKHWALNEIEFVFIDEDYHPLLGLVVVKTTKTKPMNITPKLLENPKKFWAKIPQRDKTFNNFDVKLISNLNDFVEKLKNYGVKVYWRKKGDNKIEVINRVGENLKIEGGDR